MACIPYVTVQHDYPHVFADIVKGNVVAERIWVSTYALNAPSASIHSRILLVSDEQQDSSDDKQKNDTGRNDVVFAEIKPENEIFIERIPGAPKDFVIASVFRPAADSVAPPSTSGRHLQQRIHLPPVRCVAPNLTLPYPSAISPLRLRKGVNAHISAFDISPNGRGLYVAGGPDGKCWIGKLPPASSAEGPPAQAALQPSVVLDGHVGDITSARFFPSGEVVITTSSDFRICIFSALPTPKEDGSTPSPSINAPVRTLVAHTRAPTCTAILGKGRIVLSGGKDGYIRCWNVGEAKEVGNLPAAEAVVSSLFGPAIECMVLGPDPSAVGNGNADDAQGEVDLFPGLLPLLAVGLSSGEVVIHDLRKCSLGDEGTPSSGSAKPVRVQPANTIRSTVPAPVFPPGPPLDASDPARAWAGSRSSSPVSALAWDAEGHNLVVGYQNGIVAVYSVSQLLATEPNSKSAGGLLALWKRNDASITQVVLGPQSTASATGRALHLVTTTSDGLACRLRLELPTEPSAGDAPDQLAVPVLEEEYIGWECGDGIAAAGVVSGQHGTPGEAAGGPTGRVLLAGAEGAIRLYR
ncbi:hypothetical protein OC835_004543 [Tilletia horrida]|nr:hypothetical protein OC835_004543 [Tilletia horrida]